MKKLLIVLFLFCLYSVKAQENTNSVIGKWVGEDKNTVVVEFFENKTANLLMMGKQIPISEYKVDYTKSPVWVDFYIKMGHTIKLYGLVEFIDAKTIKWEVFPMGTERHTSFTVKTDNSITILKKL